MSASLLERVIELRAEHSAKPESIKEAVVCEAFLTELQNILNLLACKEDALGTIIQARVECLRMIRNLCCKWTFVQWLLTSKPKQYQLLLEYFKQSLDQLEQTEQTDESKHVRPEKQEEKEEKEEEQEENGLENHIDVVRAVLQVHCNILFHPATAYKSLPPDSLSQICSLLLTRLPALLQTSPIARALRLISPSLALLRCFIISRHVDTEDPSNQSVIAQLLTLAFRILRGSQVQDTAERTHLTRLIGTLLDRKLFNVMVEALVNLSAMGAAYRPDCNVILSYCLMVLKQAAAREEEVEDEDEDEDEEESGSAYLLLLDALCLPVYDEGRLFTRTCEQVLDLVDTLTSEAETGRGGDTSTSTWQELCTAHLRRQTETESEESEVWQEESESSDQLLVCFDILVELFCLACRRRKRTWGLQCVPVLAELLAGLRRLVLVLSKLYGKEVPLKTARFFAEKRVLDMRLVVTQCVSLLVGLCGSGDEDKLKTRFQPVIPYILQQTCIDDWTPFLPQATVLCIRLLTEGCEENQAYIREIAPKRKYGK